MFPGMSPKQVNQAMKKMGVRQEEIPASEVIIKSDGRDIVVKNPSVVKVKMMGSESFQITGDVEERESRVEISEDDVKTVSEQAGVPESEARESLKTTGDLAESIMQLKKDEKG